MTTIALDSFIKPYLNKVHCGDCHQIMRRMPVCSVDLIVTSPQRYLSHDNSMPHDEYVTWQRKCLKQMMALLKPSGAIFYNHKWHVQGGLLQDRSDIVEGFPVRQIIIVKIKAATPIPDGYFVPTYEVIYLICKPEFKLSPKSNAIGDVWQILADKGNAHPAPFPLEIPLRCIGATDAKIVLDPFCGSGTTLDAAKQLGRNWIGIDNSKEYCEMSEKRLSI